MKRFAQTTLILASVLVPLLLIGGCDLSEYNDNPNAPTQADPNNVLANAQRDLAFETYGGNPTMRGTNLLGQYTTQNFYPTESRYGSIGFDDFYDFFESMNDLRRVKELSRQEGLVSNPDNVEAVALITQTWAFHIVTDTWGDIPFNESLQAAEQRSPSYTPQEEIYPALVDSLDKALNLVTGNSGPSGDLYLDGDMENWQRFANGLKMRIGMRAIDAGGSWAEEAITSANGNALQSNEDNVLFQFATSSTHRNTYYENRVVSGRDDFDAADRFVEALQQYDVEDPRLDAYFEQTSDTEPPCEDGSGEYEGFPYGREQGNAQNQYSANPSCVFSRPEAFFSEGLSGEGDAYAPIMYYDEVLSIKAEAAARGIINGDAKSFLEDAVRASIDFYGSETEADISGTSSQTDDYVNAVLDDYDENGFEQVIGEQKWIAFYFNDVQGWSTWRRLDFEGHIKPPTGGPAQEFGVAVPLRVDYPQSEYSLNNENVTEAAEQQFGSVDEEDFGGRLWWDTDGPPAEVQ